MLRMDFDGVMLHLLCSSPDLERGICICMVLQSAIAVLYQIEQLATQGDCIYLLREYAMERAFSQPPWFKDATRFARGGYSD